MNSTIRLTVVSGPHRNCKFCFCGPARCMVGRALDCFVRLCGAERDERISRHHCQLEIAPPAIHVRDLGSTNGTYLNGKRVFGCPADAAAADSEINDGDLLTIGGTTIRVDIVTCPHAGQEGTRFEPEGDVAIRGCHMPC
jgi:pSer/pThr/pTyr-binding forkhead associated (FHA) protein